MVLGHKNNDHYGLMTLDHNDNDPLKYPYKGSDGLEFGTFGASISFILMFYPFYTWCFQ